MQMDINESRPCVSVVIPTYNAPDFLTQALDSVFEQNYEDSEIIIVNDGSTDDTGDRIDAYVAAHCDRAPMRLRVVTQENQGIGAARNQGIAEARGKYVALLDHDDLWKPGKLAAQVAFMEAHPQCVGCAVPWSRSTDPDRSVFDISICDAEGVVEDPLAVLAGGTDFLITSALMFDRVKAGGLKYETQRQCIEDLPFQIALFGRGAFGIAGREVLMVYREHEGSYSKQAVFYDNGLRMLRRLEREGRFDEFVGQQRQLLMQYIGRFGRSAVVHDLAAGKRTAAGRLYLAEFPYQLALGRWRFLTSTPLLIASPTAVLRRRWSGFSKR